MPKFKFEKTFLIGKGKVAWYQKATIWAWKQHPVIQPFLIKMIQWLKQKWIEVKIENTMNEVDNDIEKIHDLWDEEESNRRMNTIAQNGNDGLHYFEEDSEVKGLKNIGIGISTNS